MRSGLIEIWLLQGPMLSFCALYNDLHFPSHTSIPPCVTLQLAHLSIVRAPALSDIGLEIDLNTDTVGAGARNSNMHVSLPTCAVCIRRLTRAVSGVHSPSAPPSSPQLHPSPSTTEFLGLLVGPDFVDNGDRCC